STTPSREAIEDGEFEGTFEVIVETGAGEEAVRTIASGPEIALLELSSSASPQQEPFQKPEPAPGSQSPPASPQVQRRPKRRKRREIRNIRVDIQRLDRMMNLVEDLVINRGRLEQIARKHGIKEFDEALSMVGRSVSELQNLMMGIR